MIVTLAASPALFFPPIPFIVSVPVCDYMGCRSYFSQLFGKEKWNYEIEDVYLADKQFVLQINNKLEVSSKILAEFFFSKKNTKSFYISFKYIMSYFMGISIFCWICIFSLALTIQPGSSSVMKFIMVFFCVIAIFLLIPLFLCIHYDMLLLLLKEFDLLFLMGNLIVFMVAEYMICIERGVIDWAYAAFHVWLFLFMTFVNILDSISFSVVRPKTRLALTSSLITFSCIFAIIFSTQWDHPYEIHIWNKSWKISDVRASSFWTFTLFYVKICYTNLKSPFDLVLLRKKYSCEKIPKSSNFLTHVQTNVTSNNTISGSSLPPNQHR